MITVHGFSPSGNCHKRHLTQHDWFTGDAYGVADIALFAYTGVAPHGGVDLAGYPAIGDWLQRVRRTPGFVAMPEPDPDAAALIAAST